MTDWSLANNAAERQSAARQGERLPDVFISYSSKDRPVADRLQKTLTEAGYDVFWDQDTPAGIDWDSWIRERLHGSACVIVLWSKASIASANVRHEAIVAREAGKLLPVMIDALQPADFPMGLYMVQGLVMGRSAKDFAAARGRLLAEVADRIGARRATAAAETPPPRRRIPKKWVAVGAAALLLLALLFVGPPLIGLLDPRAPPVPAAEVEAALAVEPAARERIARAAETTLAADQEEMGTPWFAGQLLSGAPDESRPLLDRYFNLLPAAANPACGCYRVHGIPHSIGNAWVLITSATFRRPPPASLIPALLANQHRDGWWSISLSGAGDPASAATHATALVTIALAEARRSGIVPSELRPRLDDAVRSAVAWLNRGPDDGAQWPDYPGNGGRTRNLVFAAMATVATHLAGETGPRPPAAAFRRAAAGLPGPTAHLPSKAVIRLAGGESYTDSYRHPLSPWIGAAAMLAYRDASLLERHRLRRIVHHWLAMDLSDRRLLQHDWIVAETLVLRRLALRELDSAR
jgi:hypothetical protein